MRVPRFDAVHLVLAALCGALLAVGVRGLEPAAIAQTGATWRCYASDKMGNLGQAQAAENLAQLASGLNQVATNAPVGAIFSVHARTEAAGPRYADAFCVHN